MAVATGLLLSREATPIQEGAGRVASQLAVLALRAQAGEDRAFDELMQATQERVLALAWRLAGSRDDARDAAQETFLRAYRYLSRYRPEHDFGGWLYRIVVNACRDLRRRQRPRWRRTVSLETMDGCKRYLELPSEEDPDEAVLTAERKSLLMAALSTLPPRERAALVLRDLEGKTSEEAAKILGSRPGTVRAQVASARHRLKRSLARIAASTTRREE
jgi:RNA polymerase sigma-70 factor (ECF subfamily)